VEKLFAADVVRFVVDRCGHLGWIWATESQKTRVEVLEFISMISACLCKGLANRLLLACELADWVAWRTPLWCIGFEHRRTIVEITMYQRTTCHGLANNVEHGSIHCQYPASSLTPLFPSSPSPRSSCPPRQPSYHWPSPSFIPHCSPFHQPQLASLFVLPRPLLRYLPPTDCCFLFFAHFASQISFLLVGFVNFQLHSPF